MTPSGLPGPMRSLILLAALALLAGCVTPPGTTTPPTNGTTNTTAGMSALPPSINDTKDVQGSADPLNLAPGGAPCQSPSSQCFKYPFEMNGTGHIAATLSWGEPASDFDLYVFKDGKVVSTGGANDVAAGPSTSASEKVDMDLETGKYELVVAAWAVAQDTYKVAATFTAATAK